MLLFATPTYSTRKRGQKTALRIGCEFVSEVVSCRKCKTRLDIKSSESVFGDPIGGKERHLALASCRKHGGVLQPADRSGRTCLLRVETQLQ